MNYLHPDVLDNGPAYLRASAARVLVLHDFAPGLDYAQVLASSLISVPLTPEYFQLQDADAGRELLFVGVIGAATKGIEAGSPLHLVFTDGAERVLWAAVEPSQRQILAGQSYRLPAVSFISTQPQ